MERDRKIVYKIFIDNYQKPYLKSKSNVSIKQFFTNKKHLKDLYNTCYDCFVTIFESVQAMIRVT